jgi:hypothetical protein
MTAQDLERAPAAGQAKLRREPSRLDTVFFLISAQERGYTAISELAFEGAAA